MRIPLLILLSALGLSACQQEQPRDVSGYGVSTIDPNTTQTEKTACEARGGTFRPAGLAGLMTCFETPKDAGKSCGKSGDCSTGQCLARSRSCSPITPLFGCNEVLDAEGRVVSLCVD
ncbi:hypothetical protein [Celeribacter neptunius]|uniref:Lipoprotein n=1 Tax=Celeribacter neptunius TaxID=588602 RepID=A0A1I3IUD8_9RHOB|nr:hypothetical protein [Celeribacter neptunius]SFI51507.1 hypothetical protein SAMN04487991_0138 [Celeribacter neptunius]